MKEINRIIFLENIIKKAIKLIVQDDLTHRKKKALKLYLLNILEQANNERP